MAHWHIIRPFST